MEIESRLLKMQEVDNIYTDIPKALSNLGFVIGKILENSAHIPLRQYLKTLIPGKKNTNNKYFNYVLKGISEYLFKYKYHDIDGVCSHFESHPVIQQADHSNILLDEKTFLNNYLFAIASAEAGAKKMVISQCSTVSCLSRRDPVEGPVFLRTRGELLKLFSFSKRMLKDSSFCSLPGPIVLDIKVLDGETRNLAEDSLLSSFIGRKFETSTECYYVCNNEIWQKLGNPFGIERIGVDESMTSKIASYHICDEDSPIYKLFFDPHIRDTFLEVKKNLISLSQKRVINRASPDFLWFRKGYRLVPLILVGQGEKAQFYLEDQNIPLPFTFGPATIANALQNGDLFVDRIIAYLVRCLLPGVVAVGGTSQQDYVLEYQKMLLECHNNAPFLSSEEISQVQAPNLSLLGGAPLLELNLNQKKVVSDLSESTDLKAFDDTFLELPVGITIGKLNCARYLLENYKR